VVTLGCWLFGSRAKINANANSEDEVHLQFCWSFSYICSTDTDRRPNLKLSARTRYYNLGRNLNAICPAFWHFNYSSHWSPVVWLCNCMHNNNPAIIGFLTSSVTLSSSSSHGGSFATASNTTLSWSDNPAVASELANAN
jgi:hypothetical protein